MCCAYAAASWSRLALLLGLAAAVLQALSLFTGSWLLTKEVLAPPEPADDGQPAGTSSSSSAVRYGGVVVHTRVGLLRTCVRLEKINGSSYPYPGPQPTCFSLTTNLWQEVTSADLGILHGSIQSTAQVVTNVRQYTLVLGSVALGLMVLGELGALVSHFKPSNRLGVVLACYLYLFAGLIVCLVVVTFSMMTEVPRREVAASLRLPAHRLPEAGWGSWAPFTWELGTSYYLAVIAFALTHLIAAVLVSAFMRRFSSLEAMVREVVPGADRKLREHQENNLVGLWEIYPSRAMRQLGCITLPGAMGCYGKLSSDAAQLGGGERGLHHAAMASSKTKPDICSSNPESSADSLQQQLQQQLQAEDAADGQDHQMRAGSPFEPSAAGGRSVSLGQPMSLTASSTGGGGPQPAGAAQAAAPGVGLGLPAGLPPPPDSATLAGVSVPITVMRPRPLGHPGHHRTIPCGAVEDATPLDTFPSYGAPGGVPMDGTMTVARRKPGSGGGGGAVAGPPVVGAPAPAAFSTLDNRSRCAGGAGRLPAGAGAGAGHTHTLPHPPRQF
ncbi:Voltage-dependent calcium channel gamma-5 subunit [Frankliniella fusca]|uniref:Voltage-dependent calcium channel gamma-5 subunit n=1 Tax=Frankliniella fusca TaxID=407009 RepID=A0AAE1HD89_9NEOP|nr:Voltage-dependent calcium channel gamma-5 subunit [Frankliniella fusca]